MADVNVATLTAKLQAETRDFERGMNKAEQSLKGVEDQTKKTAGRMESMNKLFRAAAAAGLVAYGKELFGLGVEVEAWGRRYETVFGDASSTLDKWIDDHNERFGVAEDRMRGMAAATGDLLVPMGFLRSDAAAMTSEVLTLSGALSEWTGGARSAEEVSQILTKALLGEREALKSLGVSLKDTEIKARLADKGLAGLTGEALAQAEAMVALELITEKSADALNAFSSGQTDAQAAMSNAQAAFDQLKVDLSKTVVALAPLVSSLASMVSVLNTIPGVVPGVVAAFAAMALGAGPFITTIVAATAAYMAFRQATGGGTAGRLGNMAAVARLGSSAASTAGRTRNPNLAGARAAGGPVTAGGTFLVGERGPELFTPSRSGSITPNHRMGGQTVTVHVAGSVISEGELVDRIRQALRAETIRGGSLEFA